MPLYECVFIARNDVTQQQVESIADTIGIQLDADKGIVAPVPEVAPAAVAPEAETVETEAGEAGAPETNASEAATSEAGAAEATAAAPRTSVSVKKREYWGLRSLAYRIKKNRKGHYMFLGLDAAPASILEMERQLRLNEDVLRFMTLRVEAIAEAPSAILSRKSDDRERGFRGPKPPGRFDSGRKRSYDDREEFRARDESPSHGDSHHHDEEA